MTDADVIVIGGGAAGLLAATRAGERGLRTLLLEKNRRPGVKILMSGGTRCNLTQHTDAAGIARAFGAQGPFLRSALAALPPGDLVRLVEEEGVPTKVEPTGKIFPVSDRASDILMSFERRLERSGARLLPERNVREIHRDSSGFLVCTTAGDFTARALIVTTGGQSYPLCGTAGDGYAWARALGHSCVPPRPALVPITVETPWVRELKGISLDDVELRVLDPVDDTGKALVGGAFSGGSKSKLIRGQPVITVDHSAYRVLDTRRGSMLFTHFGLSGPAILDISRPVARHEHPQTLRLLCDLCPRETADAMRKEFDRRRHSQGGKSPMSLLEDLFPERLATALVRHLGWEERKRIAELPREAREQLIQALKGLLLPISGTMGFRKAEVTSGGVHLDEVDSRSMVSKRVPNLYFAGEVLDLDGPIGGYNFQAAFSTGWLAGSRVLADK